MDSAKARLFGAELVQHGRIADWTILDVVDHGKSAVVLRAEKNGGYYAVKVFHPEVVEKYGEESQLKRIEREKSLIGISHASLVDIYDGGRCPHTNHPYVVMRLVSGQRLSDALQYIPRDRIRPLIEQLARASKALEDLGLVHRDIKPDNIAVNDEYTALTLLDFGVMHPVGDSSATDQPGYKPFIGTHQYSPPELLHRQEEDTVEGWQAITFYQIGAVLYDLINRRPIFDEYAGRHADLVKAIDETRPLIAAPDVDIDLISLANRCLLKKPLDRRRVVTWSDFYFSEAPPLPTPSQRRERLLKLQQGVAQERGTGFDLLEEKRAGAARVEQLKALLLEQWEGALAGLAGVLPVRITHSWPALNPDPAISTSFAADPGKGFKDAFHLQISMQAPSGSSVVTIFVRAGLGTDATEITWTRLGDVIEDLSDGEPLLSQWIVQMLESLISV